MKTRLILITLVAAAAAVTATAQPARPRGPQGPHDGPGGCRERRPHFERMADDLDLAPQQRAELAELHRAFRKNMQTLRREAQEARRETRRLWNDPQASRERVMAAVEAECAAMNAMRMARAEHRLRVRELVGPEKEKHLTAKRREFREKWRDQRRDDAPSRERRRERPEA